MSPSEFVSIFNDVLGPVMRGPSSSHTAGSYHIGRVARSLLGEAPAAAVFTFDPDGSYAATFRQQSADKAFAAGLMGWLLIDDRFPRALETAEAEGLRLSFRVAALDGADHPNTVRIELRGASGSTLRLMAKSTGGGGFLINQIEDWAAAVDGKSFEIRILVDKGDPASVEALLNALPGDKAFSITPLPTARWWCCGARIPQPRGSWTTSAAGPESGACGRPRRSISRSAASRFSTTPPEWSAMPESAA